MIESIMPIIDTIENAREYLAPEEIDVVIYHSPCSDGWAAAASAWMKNNNITMIPARHHHPINEDLIADKNVAVIDFSFKSDELAKLRNLAKKIIILDHHKTALEELSEIEGCFFEMENSGAMLSWSYFHGTALPAPEFITLVEDRDLWRFDYGRKTKALQAYITNFAAQNPGNSFYFKPQQLALLMLEENLIAAITKGLEILDSQEQWVSEMKLKVQNKTMIIKEQSYTVKTMELASSYLSSELADAVKDDCDFVLLWYKTHENKFKVSLRSAKDGGADVSLIAKHFDGGGHHNAAGFETDICPSAFF